MDTSRMNYGVPLSNFRTESLSMVVEEAFILLRTAVDNPRYYGTESMAY